MRTIILAAPIVLILAAPSSSRAWDGYDLTNAMDMTNVDGVTLVLGDDRMFDVRDDLGVLSAQAPPMALLYTGMVANLPSCMDDDLDGALDQGDKLELLVDLTAPGWAQSLSFHSYFLTREYPDYVGSVYNDSFTVDMASTNFNGNIVFDGVGNVVDVNTALFVVTDPLLLQDTGFDGCDETGRGGGTGWLLTVAPVAPGEAITLTFRIGDVSDGIYDSAVLLDSFSWHEHHIGVPCTAHLGDDACGDPGDDDTGDDDAGDDDVADDDAADDDAGDDDVADDDAGADDDTGSDDDDGGGRDTCACRADGGRSVHVALGLMLGAVVLVATRRARSPRR